MKKALLVIDVQNYFLQKSPDSLLKDIVNECQSEYDLLVFTAFRNTFNSNFVKSLGWQECMSKSDATIPASLTPFANEENTFVHNAYSAFRSSDLKKHLADSEIQKIVMCGIDTDACLLATAFDAFDNGFRVEVNLASHLVLATYKTKRVANLCAVLSGG